MAVVVVLVLLTAALLIAGYVTNNLTLVDASIVFSLLGAVALVVQVRRRSQLRKTRGPADSGKPTV